VQLRDVRGRGRRDDADRDSGDEPGGEEAGQALGREIDDRADDRDPDRREQETPSPLQIGEMPREEQRDDNPDRVHRECDRDHEQ
jgi:hypothetical protein